MLSFEKRIDEIYFKFLKPRVKERKFMYMYGMATSIGLVITKCSKTIRPYEIFRQFSDHLDFILVIWNVF